jgi:hypothetical protein
MVPRYGVCRSDLALPERQILAAGEQPLEGLEEIQRVPPYGG